MEKQDKKAPHFWQQNLNFWMQKLAQVNEEREKETVTLKQT
jgi:hypothetical protein